MWILMKSPQERWLARNTQENRGTTECVEYGVACLEQHILQTRAVADIVVKCVRPLKTGRRFFKRCG